MPGLELAGRSSTLTKRLRTSPGGVNIEGVWFVGQEAARRMVAHRIKGTIINVSSILGYQVKDATAYSVGKAAVVHMTNAMAVDLREARRTA